MQKNKLLALHPDTESQSQAQIQPQPLPQQTQLTTEAVQYPSDQVQQYQKVISKVHSQQQILQLQSQLLYEQFHRDHPREEFQFEIKRIEHNSVIFIARYGEFKLQLNLLFSGDLSALLGEPINKGNFGSVYFLRYREKHYVIKAFYFKQQNLWKQLKQIMRQYFVCYVASILKVGPHIEKIFGYNMIVMKQCILFDMEYCYSVDMKKFEVLQRDLKESLSILHAIKFFHMDIKPDNIGYSPRHKKNVFLDFGLSCFRKVDLGYKTKTEFAGSLAFCSKQMKALYLLKTEKPVDLFNNDAHALKKTLYKLLVDYQTGFRQFYQQKPDLIESCIPEQCVDILLARYCIFSKRYDQFNQIVNSQSVLRYSMVELLNSDQSVRFLKQNQQAKLKLVGMMDDITNKKYQITKPDSVLSSAIKNSKQQFKDVICFQLTRLKIMKDAEFNLALRDKKAWRLIIQVLNNDFNSIQESKKEALYNEIKKLILRIYSANSDFKSQLFYEKLRQFVMMAEKKIQAPFSTVQNWFFIRKFYRFLEDWPNFKRIQNIIIQYITSDYLLVLLIILFALHWDKITQGIMYQVQYQWACFLDLGIQKTMQILRNPLKDKTSQTVTQDPLLIRGLELANIILKRDRSESNQNSCKKYIKKILIEYYEYFKNTQHELLFYRTHILYWSLCKEDYMQILKSDKLIQFIIKPGEAVPSSGDEFHTFHYQKFHKSKKQEQDLFENIYPQHLQNFKQVLQELNQKRIDKYLKLFEKIYSREPELLPSAIISLVIQHLSPFKKYYSVIEKWIQFFAQQWQKKDKYKVLIHQFQIYSGYKLIIAAINFIKLNLSLSSSLMHKFSAQQHKQLISSLHKFLVITFSNIKPKPIQNPIHFQNIHRLIQFILKNTTNRQTILINAALIYQELPTLYQNIKVSFRKFSQLRSWFVCTLVEVMDALDTTSIKIQSGDGLVDYLGIIFDESRMNPVERVCIGLCQDEIDRGCLDGFQVRLQIAVSYIKINSKYGLYHKNKEFIQRMILLNEKENIIWDLNPMPYSLVRLYSIFLNLTPHYYLVQNYLKKLEHYTPTAGKQQEFLFYLEVFMHFCTLDLLPQPKIDFVQGQLKKIYVFLPKLPHPHRMRTISLSGHMCRQQLQTSRRRTVSWYRAERRAWELFGGRNREFAQWMARIVRQTGAVKAKGSAICKSRMEDKISQILR